MSDKTESPAQYLIDPTASEAKYPEAAQLLRTAAGATQGNAYQRWQDGPTWAVKEQVALSAVQAALEEKAAFRQMVAEQLSKLLYSADVLAQVEPIDQVSCMLRNNEIRRAATRLGIDLSPL